ncbi:MAG: histidine kinase dimerization/phosphoacceptor domain -containing protein [Rhodoferax sp.]
MAEALRAGPARAWQRIALAPVPWLAGGFLLVSGLLLVWALLAMRAQQLEAGWASLADSARVLEETTEQTLQATALRLEMIAQDLQDTDLAAPDPALAPVLERQLRQVPVLDGGWVQDKSGRVLVVTGRTPASGTGDALTRALARVPAAQDGLLIAPSEAAPSARIPVGWPIRDRRGLLRGQVVALIDPVRLASLWAPVDLGEAPIVALYRQDRTLLLRSPPTGGRPESAMFGLPEAVQGHFRTPAQAGEPERHFAYRKLHLWPELRLVAGQARSGVLAGWQSVALLALAIWLAVAAAVGALVVHLRRLHDRHAAVERSALVLGRRLELATSQLAIGVWEWDLVQDVAYGSPSYYTMLGYPPREGVIDRQFWFDICHPDDLAHAQDCIRRALEGAIDHYEYDTRLRHADGTYRWIRLLGQVNARDAQGRATRIVGVRTDIHQQRLAEDALRRSEALNEAVLNSVQAQIAVLDRSGRVVAVNSPWREAGRISAYLGAQGGEPVGVGASYLDIGHKVRALAREPHLVTQAADGIREVLEGRSTGFTLSYPCRTPGSEGWFALQVTPLSHAQGGAVVAHTDISERMQAEDELRRLMRLYALRTAINRAIIGQRDPQRLLQEICRAAIAHGQFGMAWIGQADPRSGRILPLASAGESQAILARLVDPADGHIDAASIPLPRSPSDVHSTADIASQHETWPVWVAEALERGFRSAATLGFAADGRQDASVHLFAREPGFFKPAERLVLRDIGGDISNALAALGSEAAREKAELALHTLLRDKEALLKEVHHRVKNNLQVVSSLLRLEASRDVTPATASVLRDMQGRIQAMALLHESLYGSGDFASVDLGAYLRQLATQAFATFSTGSGGVHLEVALSSVQVSMDQAITCGLLVNELLSNSLKHGFPGGRGGTVQIRLQATEDGAHMRLQVGDDGVGLPADLEQRQTRSLGLQLATDLAGQLGGVLQHHNGPGAQFAVEFQVDESP